MPRLSNEATKARVAPSTVLALALLGCHAHATGTASLNVNAQASEQATGESTTPEQPDAATPPPPTKTVFAKVLIEFETDKSDLDDGDKKNLGEFIDDICDAHSKNPNATVVVEGHADARGTATHNVELSQRRAQAIRDWIVANNKLCQIGDAQIVVKGKGEGEPACRDPLQCVAADGSPLGPESQCKKCWEQNRMTIFALEAAAIPARAAPPPAPPAPPPPEVQGHPKGCGCEAAGLDAEGIGGGVAGMLAGMLVVLRRWRRLRERRAPFVLPVALACAACGMIAIQETPINSPPAPMTPRDPGKVEVFTAGPPSKPYVEIAMLEAQQQDEYSGDVVAKLREYAAHKGCDGIVVTGSSEREAQNKLDKNQTVTLKGYRATCIVYKPAATDNK